MTRATVPASPTSTVVQMPLARLRAHPRNVRTSLGDLRELAGSIRQLGVLQPLVVERRGEVYQILAGHRRAAAARLAGLRTVPCVITRPVETVDAIALMLTENEQRRGLNSAERRAAATSLRREFGRSVAQIAQQLGIAQSTVYSWLAADTGQTTSRRRSDGPPQRAPLPALNKVRATELHRLVAWYDRGRGSFDRGAAGRALRDEVAALLGDWSPGEAAS